MLLIYIDRLSLFSHLYRTLLDCLSMCPGSWVGTTTLCIELRWCCTIAVSAWCSAHQLVGCECTGNRSCAPLGCQNGADMSIYGHMQPYIHAFTYTYELKYIYIFIIFRIHKNVYWYLNSSIYRDTCIHRCILACIWSCPALFKLEKLIEILTKSSFLVSTITM